MNLSLHLDRPLLFLGIWLALSLWALWIYARSRPDPGPRRRRLLLALRLTASLLLSLMIGGWSLHGQRSDRIKPGLTILLDSSASMALPPAAGEEGSRYETALGYIEQLREGLGESADLEVLAFDEKLRPEGVPALAEGPATNLAAALEALPVSPAGHPLLILSDGQVTDADLWSAPEGHPVFTVLFGDSLAPDDARLERVEGPPVLQRGERGLLTVEIQVAGEGARRGRLLLTEEGRTLLERDWNLPEGRRSLTLELPLSFDEPGTRILELVLIPEGPDATESNNRRSVSFQVLDETLKVLVLAGRPDWDLSFLLAALREDPSLDLQLVTPAEGGRLLDADSGQLWSPAGQGYHALLIHSLPPFPLEGIGELLRPAGGLLLMPGVGADATWPESWDLAGVGPRGMGPEGAALAWGREAGRHEVLRGLPQRGPSLAALPPLEAVGQWNLPPRSRSLIRAGTFPLLALRERAAGRQAFWTGEGLHRWGLRDEAAGDFLEDLFSGLLRWLGRPRAPHRIQILDEGQSLPAGRETELRSRLFATDFSVEMDGRLRWWIRREGELLASGRFEAPGESGDDYRAALPALPAGRLDLQLRAETASGEVLERTLDLVLLPGSEETRRSEANPATLRWLAAIGGGIFQVEPDPAALLAELPLRERLERRGWSLRIWQHPLFFLLFLSLLALEWGLRKRFGMV